MKKIHSIICRTTLSGILATCCAALCSLDAPRTTRTISAAIDTSSSTSQKVTPSPSPKSPSLRLPSLTLVQRWSEPSLAGIPKTPYRHRFEARGHSSRRDKLFPVGKDSIAARRKRRGRSAVRAVERRAAFNSGGSAAGGLLRTAGPRSRIRLWLGGPNGGRAGHPWRRPTPPRPRVREPPAAAAGRRAADASDPPRHVAASPLAWRPARAVGSGPCKRARPIRIAPGLPCGGLSSGPGSLGESPAAAKGPSRSPQRVVAAGRAPHIPVYTGGGIKAVYTGGGVKAVYTGGGVKAVYTGGARLQ